MSGYGLFQSSTLGMMSQAHRLNTIGYNIANVNTGGFKRTDTQFETLLSKNIYQQTDNGGVKPYAIATNDIQGLVTTSSRALDLAISGQGFFSLQADLDSSDRLFYTRDGSFQVSLVDGATSSITADDGETITVQNGYLVDKNGYFVRGVPVNADGTFSAGSAGPMRVDQYAFIDAGQSTSTAELEFNLPSNAVFGDTASPYTLSTFDSAFERRDINFSFAPTSNTNEWRVSFTADNMTTGSLTPSSAYSLAVDFAGSGETLSFDATTNRVQLFDSGGNGIPNAFSDLMPGDTITFGGTASNNTTLTISNIINNGSTLVFDSGVTTETTAANVTASSTINQPLVFTNLGALESPDELTLTATWDNGETSSFTIDISKMTQFSGAFTPYRSGQNGYPQADLTDIAFNIAGEVVGTFSDGTQRAIYKIPLYDFTNPNGLKSSNGMIFSETSESGSPVAFFADESDKAQFVPFATEVSNVDIAQEFSLMIQTQNAYNMCATTFKTIDEMTTVARDLKA